MLSTLPFLRIIYYTVASYELFDMYYCASNKIRLVGVDECVFFSKHIIETIRRGSNGAGVGTGVETFRGETLVIYLEQFINILLLLYYCCIGINNRERRGEGSVTTDDRDANCVRTFDISDSVRTLPSDNCPAPRYSTPSLRAYRRCRPAERPQRARGYRAPFYASAFPCSGQPRTAFKSVPVYRRTNNENKCRAFSRIFVGHRAER